MLNSRLSLALNDGLLSLPETGKIVVFGARADHDLSALPKDRVEIVQGFYPDHAALTAQGFTVETTADGAFDAAVVFLSRAKPEARDMVATAMRVTANGPIIIDGQKTDGIDSMLKDCKKRGSTSAPYSKAHGKVFSVTSGDFTDWIAKEATIEDGFITAPGVFSANKIDKGSALLAATLPDTIKGRVADLGAGWGYLSRRILENPNVTECHLIEANHAALDCARQNVTDPRAFFHWADVLSYDGETSFSHIITNPPFHTGRAAEPNIGRGFIDASARMLAGRGTLWLVANRHLPYEAALAEAFIEVEEIAGDPSFKIFRAAKPRRAKR
ncbi:MAG: methyltransferase [Paracoccaceae bacterium]